ncbi:hypothetical protein GCM10022200_05590 [Microbacterium awajiense]|uniref:Uncharacterized protein n=1 Tax=Microbacterium awajiense TaxID=415214 RepID=A0ABP7A6Y1_9MICO
MAGRGITIDILANVRDALNGTGDVEQALADIESTLEDMARDGDNSVDKMSRGFRDLAKDADRSADRIEDSYRQAYRKIDRANDNIGDSGKKGFRTAADASGEFKDEALQNFGETAASFDGSMESLGQVATDTLGGVASQLPGIGIAAGAAALGIGGVTNYLTELGEKSEEIKNDIISDFLELGDALDKEAVDARVRDYLNTEDTRKQAELLAEILDINVGQAVLAMAGDYESAGVTVGEVMDGINTASGNVNTETWEGLKNTIDSTTTAMEIGEQAAKAQADAQNRTADTAKAAQEKVRDEATKTQEWLQDKLNGTYEASVKLRVDDSDVRNYRAPTKYADVRYSPSGRPMI